MPLREHYTVVAIIAAACAVFVAQEQAADRLLPEYAAIPTQITAAWGNLIGGEAIGESLAMLSTLFTGTLLHSDLEHLGFNMLLLWVFGTLASRLLGPWWTLAVFVVTGVAGMVLQVALNADSPARILGASGAVCGFEGLYLGLTLRWRLDEPDVWPLAHPIAPEQLALIAVVGIALDSYALMRHEEVGIAYGAHLGGAFAGLLIALLITVLFPTERDFAKKARC